MTPWIFVNGSFLMKPQTGVQRYAREMLGGMHSLGVKDIVILAPPQCRQTEVYGYPVVSDHRKFPWRGQWWAWEQIRLPMLVRRYDDYLLWSPSNIGPWLVKEQVITMHDALVFAGPKWFSFAGRNYYRRLLPLLARRVRHIITDSEHSKKELIHYRVVPENNISVVHLGVNMDVKRRDGMDERRYVLNLGSRDPRKNVRGLLAAWNQIEPRLKSGYRLGIVGGNIRGVVDEGLQKQSLPDVDFFGYVSDDELKQLFDQAVLFVFPSFYEGFGLPPLEAMASGVPVIVSSTTSLPEVCGEAAVYVDPYDTQDIAEKIVAMLRDPGLRLLYRQKGLEQAQRFTWKRSAQSLMDILERTKARAHSKVLNSAQ
jgi:glycosyltransferase involved in cell wall biosynthesis